MRRSRLPVGKGCRRKADGDLSTLRAIVSGYLRFNREPGERELRIFRLQKTLSAAVALAGKCELPSGKRHSHQRRLRPGTIRAIQRKLQPRAFQKVANFDQIHELVAVQIGNIKGVGKLTVYDTATRIGAYLGIEPERVYLHCGVTEGAKALGISVRGRPSVEVEELPSDFRRLSAGEIEDCLCIYKREIGAAWRR